MDVFSNGFYGGTPFLDNKNKKYFGYAFLIGMSPDIFSFGVFMATNLLGLYPRLDWSGHPESAQIPQFVHTLYDISHSLVIFAAVFFLIWIIRKKSFLPLIAWGIHILMDIPSHSDRFFPTPFLWPISDFHVNGINWGNPIVFFPNGVLLILIYGGWIL
jgi:hypothetical protein